MALNTDNILWLGHASVLLKDRLNIYIDPWEVNGPEADIILITHDHSDHLDQNTIKALLGKKTIIITDTISAAKLRVMGWGQRVTVVKSGEKMESGEITVTAVPAYNLNKDFHPETKGGLGFIINGNGPVVYHAGDTDFIPEMKDVKTQVAILPVSGTYVMTAEEAVEAALVINPEVAIPIHYGKIVGDRGMAETFAAGLKGKVTVEIKEPFVWK